MVKQKKTRQCYLEQLIGDINSLTKTEGEIDKFIKTLQQLDLSKEDILHFIENNDISKTGSIEIIKLLKSILEERREVKTTYEIYKTYGTHKNKLTQYENRDFLIAELNKCNKSLDTNYRYEVLTEEELHKLNETKTKKEKKDYVES